jgi:hypothetical protein
MCAGADVMAMWASFTSGAFAAPFYLGLHYAMLWMQGESNFELGDP